jgi:hypothetical protein
MSVGPARARRYLKAIPPDARVYAYTSYRPLRPRPGGKSLERSPGDGLTRAGARSSSFFFSRLPACRARGLLCSRRARRSSSAACLPACLLLAAPLKHEPALTPYYRSSHLSPSEDRSKGPSQYIVPRAQSAPSPGAGPPGRSHPPQGNPPKHRARAPIMARCDNDAVICTCAES